MILFSLFLVSILAGAVASVAGFGIGSLITPLMLMVAPTQVAIAIVAIPHFLATAFRFGSLKSHIDKNVFLRFGLLSALGGLLGALAQFQFQSPALKYVFGLILIFSGLMGIFEVSSRLILRGPVAGIAGVVSGFLGGLVGNQGGIRAAALLGFDISKEAFVATSTAVGLIVDTARLPVYLFFQGQELWSVFDYILVSSLGALVGTVVGMRVLRKIPISLFKRTVSALILLLGLLLLLL